jgi:hypothetical protein
MMDNVTNMEDYKLRRKNKLAYYALRLSDVREGLSYAQSILDDLPLEGFGELHEAVEEVLQIAEVKFITTCLALGVKPPV